MEEVIRKTEADAEAVKKFGFGLTLLLVLASFIFSLQYTIPLAVLTFIDTTVVLYFMDKVALSMAYAQMDLMIAPPEEIEP